MSEIFETIVPNLPDEPELPINTPEYDEDGNVVDNPTNPTEEPYEGDPDSLTPPEEDESLIHFIEP
jgi:hypothetical protein